MCLKVVASNLLLISKAWGSTLPWLPKQWCCARDGGESARWSWSWVAVCCENILLQPGSGGYFYDESASGLWHTEPCFALKKHGQNGGNPSERDVMSTCDDSQGLFDLDWRKANVPALCRGQSHQKDYGQAGCELLELLEWNMVLGGFFHRSIFENFRNSCCSPQLWTSRAVACHD